MSSKADEILKLKELLDSRLINQSDFERLKKQIFEEPQKVSIELNKITNSEFLENIQKKRIDNSEESNLLKKCSQCGSDNEIENSKCSECKTDFSLFEEKTEPYKEIDNGNNNSKYIIIGLVGFAFLIFGFFYYYQNHINQNIEDLVEANIDSTRSAPDEVSAPNYQETSIDTLVNQNDTTSADLNSNDENQNLDNYGYDNNPQDDDSTDNTIYNTADIEVKPDFQGGIGDFYKYVGKNFQVPDEEGLKGKIFISFIVEKDGSLSDIKVIKDIGHGTGQEAIRVLESCPRWIPAQQNGKKVRVLYSLPISIQSAE